MTTRRILPPLATALILLPGLALAAEYHVAPGGSDAGAGTEQDPFATLQHAADVVQPGDTVTVHAGSYAGFRLETSGEQGAPISFIAQGGVVIDQDGPTGDGIRLQNVSDVVIQGFRIESVSARGIAHRGATPDAPSRRLSILDNVIVTPAEEGMYLSEVSESLVEGNVVDSAGQVGEQLRGHCIYLANAGSDGTTIRGNELEGCLKAGIHHNGDLSIGGDGVISGLVIERNIIHDNGQNGLNMDGVQDSLIVGNLIYGNASNGLRAYAIDAAEGPKGLVIVNNTIHVPAGGGWCVRITEEAGNGGSVVFNNILMNDDDFGGAIALDGSPGFFSDANVVVGRFTPDRDATLLDLTGWQALGYDLGSVVAAPAELFADVAMADYQLEAQAVAVDFGLATFEGQSAPTVDLLGLARPQGAAIDAGAYERCPDGEMCDVGGGSGGSTGGGGGGGTSSGGGGSTSGAGTGGSGGAGDGTGLGGSSITGGGGGGVSPMEDEGCACRSAPAGQPVGPWLLALAPLVGLRRRQPDPRP